MNRLIFILIILIIPLSDGLIAKEFNREEYQIVISKNSQKPVIDGILSDEAWNNSVVIKNFWEHWPNDTLKASIPTEARITYDEKNLYVAITCYDDNSDNIIQSLKRDSENEYWQSDGIGIILDPNNKATNGYFFSVNAAGAQMEGLISQNGEFYKLDVNWDNSWKSEVSHNENAWCVEMEIPFKSLNYNPKNKTWGINFLRNDMNSNTYTTWTKFSNSFQGIDLAYTGNFVLEEIPEIQNRTFIVTPSILGGVERNIEDNEPVEYPTNLSLDSKISLNSSLSLDLTVNPDFSQVEVDQQVTNLSRFNPYFPEKRKFFLENSDLFSNLGIQTVRPIFTRKIGLDGDESVPILFGARISGNLTENSRVGIMNIQTGIKDTIQAQNYMVATFQQNIFKRSNVKTFIANRQGMDETDMLKDDYNRVGGVELNYISENSRWIVGSRYHLSKVDEKLNNNTYYGGNASYKGNQLSVLFNFDKVSENYISDIGFVPRLNNYDAKLDTTIRLGYTWLSSRLEYKIVKGKESKINIIRPRIRFENYYNDDGSLNESNLYLASSISFKKQSWVYGEFAKNTSNLPVPISIINDSIIPIGKYENDYFFFKYFANSSKTLSGEINMQAGKFYDGYKYTYGGILSLRKQPWGRFGIAYTQNNLKLKEEFGGNKIYHLIGPKAEIAFSKKMFWTTFIQYNTQIENFNINTRFQWRYKPMSELYIVITNNFNTTDYTTRNYGIIFKLNYWLNI